MRKGKKKTLADSLLAPENRDAVIADCARTLELHVNSVKGLKGMGLRTSLSMLKAGRPDAVPGAMARLMPEFVRALEPSYEAYLATQGPRKPKQKFSDHLIADPAATANLLIGVTDRRVASSSNSMLHSGYGRFRDTIAAELERAVPALARMLDSHL